MSTAASSTGRWVHTWVSAPQLTEPGNLPPAPFTRDGQVLADATLRQTARVTVGGDRLRLRFSNAFGGAVLPITAVTVARPVGGRAGVGAVESGSVRPVTFHGRAGVVVPVGAQVVSDPLDFPVGPEANLTVTAYLADGQASDLVTSHPGSRTTSHLLAGDHVEADDLPGATTTDHWYFLSGIEVWSERGGSAVVTLGDSLTDGRGSTTNGNDRWPDRLSARLRAEPPTADVAVLNQGIGGNQVFGDGLGPSALARFDRDVPAQSGVRWLVLFEGINDLCTAEASAVVQKQVVGDLCAAYEQVVVRAHAHGIKVYGATLAPLGGNEAYDDPGGHREAARQEVNEWIRGSGVFDAVLDFDAVVRDPEDPRRLRGEYDEGDHLHMTPAGYRALADAVPLELFSPSN
ncbi:MULTISPECIES: SGNH/GDSL hydrolase family protein [Saccharothrix]|uniref:SGNH/GDSL hydrolase family protein n=1 Tax=Saccharothrix TaxID=2071 RepID=UPI000940242E|nr:SGNH/GDSL hydrolase family protein [Saccharothrix sp. CB00851]OKI26965.1 SGNH hydrolase [Saccharothrix sp. CB00851]